ncbi:hypothetical protein B0H13DRAFT_2336012 [Mycena leptocephala]|nr:hypothetical protein B0H13DRAFT_2351925 [Mycena leptocephala]KAJ7901525.1 hypothetical protein B0H13DRAFT_2336012 [Mycena leptocephala]
MHFTALILLSLAGPGALVAAAQSHMDSDSIQVNANAATSGASRVSILLEDYRKSKCTGKCDNEETCDLKHGCQCYWKFQLCYKPESSLPA